MAISKAILSKIHIAKQQLGLEDETYRALLGRVCGVRSAKELTDKQASMVLKEFERLGFKPMPSKTKGKPHNFDQMSARITKIEALLADMRLPWAYADALARQMFKVEFVAWLKAPKQLDALIAALHVEQEKRGLFANVEQLLELLGERDPDWQVDLEALPAGWERRRPILKSLIETLTAAAAARGLL
ncbi:MAG TPA: regulatory protein GemA [Pseudomonas sp.]|nr:regulatory protein GemA [Pseudomonas sp.]